MTSSEMKTSKVSNISIPVKKVKSNYKYYALQVLMSWGIIGYSTVAFLSCESSQEGGDSIYSAKVIVYNVVLIVVHFLVVIAYIYFYCVLIIKLGKLLRLEFRLKKSIKKFFLVMAIDFGLKFALLFPLALTNNGWLM